MRLSLRGLMDPDPEKAQQRRPSVKSLKNPFTSTPSTLVEVEKDNFALPHAAKGAPYQDIGTIYDRYDNRDNRWQRKIETVFDVGEKPEWVKEGNLEEGPYLQYLKCLRHAWPNIGYLAEWMDVSTAPTKIKFLEHEHQIERAKRTKMAVIDYNGSELQPGLLHINTSESLRNNVSRIAPEMHNKDHTRIIIVEDLSREVIEVLGSTFEIDPLFFCGQTADYKWYNMRDAWFEATPLQRVTRSRPFYSIDYVQAKYYPDTDTRDQADRELGFFNVLRRNDSDSKGKSTPIRGHFDAPGSDGGLIRSKLSAWIRPKTDPKEGTLAIILVDPPIREGYPLWSGYHDFSKVPKMSEVHGKVEPRPLSTFTDMVERLSNLDAEAVEEIRASPRAVLRLPLMRIASEWHLAIQYAAMRLAQVTWELERPEFLHVDESSEATVEKLNPWRRRLPHMKKVVSEVAKQITDPNLDMGDEGSDITGPGAKSVNPLADLHLDFAELQSQLADLMFQTDKILSFAVNIVSIEESRKGIEQNSNVARLTYIALVFVPLSFIASLFSMTPSLGSLKQTFWIYFAVSIPTSIGLLLLARYGGLADMIVGKKKEKTKRKGESEKTKQKRL